MSFLHPGLLLALPIVALPIIIHLINQRRYQTVRWAAMMFLLAANRMARGHARLRQWLIMAMRILALGALIFAVSRPLAGGWLGLTAGGRADSTLVLIDRSPSMQQGGPGRSKLESGVRQLVPSLQTLGSSRWVLVDSGSKKANELETIDNLPDLPAVGPVGASADLPGMLQAAQDYIKASRPGRTEIWIASDLRANDWDPEDGRWPALRDGFLAFPQGVRFHLLAYPQAAPENLSIRVTDVRRQLVGDGVELLVSLRVVGGGGAKRTVPVRFEIDGARSEVPLEMAGPSAELKDHRIPLGRGRGRGWGRVSIPADVNPADDEFFFVFDEPAPRKTVVVADEPGIGRTLQLAASIAPDPALKATAEVVAPAQLGGVDWPTTALLLWQGPLPEGGDAALVRSFVDRGGVVLFLPPASPSGAKFLDNGWTEWTESPGDVGVETWRGDEDLLARTQAGASLPVGELKFRRWCGVEGESTPLATLKGGAPLLTRVPTTRGGAYFLATTPAPADSSLATEGIVLYVLTQRALADGAAVLDSTRQLVAGDAAAGDSSAWTRVAGGAEAISTDFALYPGVYAAGERLLAVNRPAAEDVAPVLEEGRVAELFRGLDYDRIDERAGGAGSLIQEIWRLFLAAMMVAVLAEAVLCLPRRAPAPRVAP